MTRALRATIPLLMVAMLAGVGWRADVAAQAFDPAASRLVDLSHDYGPDTLYWPTSPTAFEVKTLAAGDTPAGYYYSAYAFCTPEHGGTHLDAPVHFARGQRTTDQVPLGQLVAPAVVIDVSAKASAASDASYRLTVDDVREFERRHGRIARGTMVLLRTGWSRHWSDRKAYFGDDTPGDASKLRFPSFGPQAAALLVRERGVQVLGVDTASIDYGPSTDFPVHRLAAAGNVVGLENLTALEELPPTGATVMALPMKVRGGSGGPVRVVAAVPSYAGAPATGRDVPFVIPAAAAGARLGEPGVVFLHLGVKAGYDEAHIPGARFIELAAISRPRRDGDPLRLELADATSLVATFEGLGISDGTHVIVYFGKDWATPAARVFFALDYLGLGTRVSYLDGGLPAWQAAGLPVTSEAPAPAPRGRITARLNPAALADFASVREARTAPSTSVVDARDTQFYSGEDDAQGRYPRPGHIAGAVSVPFSTLLTPSGHFKTPDELRAIFRDAGIGEGDIVTSYCHIGQQASLVYFVARMLGHEARLYDGSFEEWTTRPETLAPIEKGTSQAASHGRK